MGIIPEHKAKVKVGQRFGRLVVIGLPLNFRFHRKTSRKTYVMCECDCGKTSFVAQDVLLSGSTQSCGCKRLNGQTQKDGKAFRLYSCWAAMKQRCYNENNPSFQYYGGRGVRVCDEWLNSFIAFRDWAMANGYADNLTIERKEVNGNYEPGNCCWETRQGQARNRRSTIKLTAFGQTKDLKSWVQDDRCKARSWAIKKRIKSGWDHEKAITTPDRERTLQ